MATTAYKKLLLAFVLVTLSINSVKSLYHICAIFEPQTEHYYEYGNYFLMRTFTDVLIKETTTRETETFDRFNNFYKGNLTFKYSAIFEDSNRVPFKYNSNLLPLDNAYMNYCLGIDRIPKKHSNYIVWQVKIDDRCAYVYNWNIKYFNCIDAAKQFSDYLKGNSIPHYFNHPKVGTTESINESSNYVGDDAFTFTTLMKQYFKIDNFKLLTSILVDN